MEAAAILLIVLVTAALVALVAWPLVTRDSAAPPPSPPGAREELDAELRRTLEAIREIGLDHRQGNLSDEDFATLDRDERARAVELMRRRDALERGEP